jgi:hypothetical protein
MISASKIASSDSRADEPCRGVEPSHPTSYIDHLEQIESILTSPAEFTPTTPEDRLAPLLHAIRTCDDDDLRERVDRVERWCGQLADVSRAAHARDQIIYFLNQVQSWPDWMWGFSREDVDSRKERIKEIDAAMGELCVESWLKKRVTGIPRFSSY